MDDAPAILCKGQQYFEHFSVADKFSVLVAAFAKGCVVVVAAARK